MALTKRVELLLEPRQYALLEEVARVRKESVGALIRRALEREYLEPTREEKRAAVEWLISQEMDVGSWEEIKEEIAREVVREVEKGLEAD